MKFILEITMGNEAMSSAHDVSDALNETAMIINALYDIGDVHHDTGTIMDLNGNTVGHWEFTEE